MNVQQVPHPPSALGVRLKLSAFQCSVHVTVLPKSWILSKLLGFFTLMIWIWISPANPWIFPILLALSFLACKLGAKIALEILY